MECPEGHKTKCLLPYSRNSSWTLALHRANGSVFFLSGFSQRETKTALYSEFNRGPLMFVYETGSFASLVSFPQPFLDRKLCWIYFDYSNLYLLTGHVFSTVNLNINGNKKCGEAIKEPFEEHQGTLKGLRTICKCPVLPALPDRNHCKTKGPPDPVTAPSDSGFGQINVILWDGWENLMIGNNARIVGEEM